MIRLGVIGLSKGNGHPYSWSAIFNGYDNASMERCGFPAIPRYLERQKFPEDAIAEARVTHVWAQKSEIALQISTAANIENVVACYTDMIGKVDGILLARDDAETHYEMAKPFLDAGLPIYIDKPLALSVAGASAIFDLQRYPGQVFTCSALRYAKEFQLSDSDKLHIGRLRYIHATVPQDWDKYAVHVIEPILMLAGDVGQREWSQAWQNGNSISLATRFSDGLEVIISALGDARAPIAVKVVGDQGWKDLFFEDSFFAFRKALSEFVQGIIHHDVRVEPAFVLNVIDLIECGRAR